MVYSKDVLEKAGTRVPETFDDLLAAAPKLHSAETKAYLGAASGAFTGSGRTSSSRTAADSSPILRAT